ncbi:MAG: biotin carboxylase N-terminal domain-containing protein [Microthrixaceae bacterium]
MIERVLVANRGEIARRVFRTCRDLGIGTVAVFSDADAAMPFVREADVAVHLHGNTPTDTYLRGDLVVDAARRAGADAVHPGYGFLSENAEFARAVIDAGLTWIGPTPESIDAMGSKVRSKELMAAAGVPVLGDLTVETATAADLPLLVKASAGGGGRGMRVVTELDALAAEVAAASAEAASAFGDGTVFVEPYVQHGRHVEVQVLGTAEGTLVLGERDCSVQRRHQKVIEEAPAPALPDATRAALHGAARAAAESIGYLGAGTVEFLYDPVGDRFFFLEMNTRLQVEHPVTEAVTGVDLVALQLAVAEGSSLTEIESRIGSGPGGHAVEVRLYAEDPADRYQPQSGRLSRFEVPNVVAGFANPATAGIRLDSGVGAGDEIGTFYDAMIAKVVSWAPTRDEALRRLTASLAAAEIHGVRTNRDLLVNLLRHPVVADARMDTTWLDGAAIDVLGAPPAGPEAVALSGFAAAVAIAERDRLSRSVQQRIPAGFRNVVAEPHCTSFTDAAGEQLDVRWYGGDRISSADRDGLAVIAVADSDASAVTVTLEADGVRRGFTVYLDGDQVDVESSSGHVNLRRIPRFADPTTRVAEGSLLAPMPGSVVAVHVATGAAVREGEPLLVMEAMKMQHTISAPYDGTVTELAADVGQQVEAGAVLAVVQPAEDQPEGDHR